MKIQINKYDTEVYNFAKVYLKEYEDEWLYTPPHRLASSEFLRKLEDGDFDTIEYDIKINPSTFNAEECFIVFRYYNKHKDMHKHYDKHVNVGRIYTELGRDGNIFKNRKMKSKKSKKDTSKNGADAAAAPAAPAADVAAGGKRYHRTRRAVVRLRVVKRFKTPATVKRGLMFKKTPLDDDSGALFVYTSARPTSVWMKNTYIPLDAIVIDNQKKVVQTIKNMKPLSERSHKFRSKKSAGFIETNAGFVNKNKIRVGTQLHFYGP